MRIRIDSEKPWSQIFVGMAATLLFALPAGAAPILQDNGYAYVEEDFSSKDYEKSADQRIWDFAACTQTPHGTKDGSAPNTQYKTFGMASRRGYCDYRTEGGNQFLRFITMPFDRRDAADDHDNFRESYDDGKGGSEMRGRRSYSYDGTTNKQGWDFLGQHYLTPTNTVRYSWKFRLYNVSMLEPDATGEPLAGEADVGQFHPNTAEAQACGPAGDSAPAPGLKVRVAPGADGSQQVYFTLFTKIKNSQVPPGVQKCSTDAGQADSICKLTLWEQAFPMASVTRVDSSDTRIPPWISIAYVMRPSATNGALKFVFGIEGSSDESLVFQNRLLAGANENRFVTHIPLTQNSCPNKPYLGAYVLDYNRKYYGFRRIDVGNLYTPKRYDQEPPSTWVHDNVLNDPHLSSYIRGTWANGDTAPQLIVDFDDFRIVQVQVLP